MPDYGDVNPDTGRGSARTEFEGTMDPLAPGVWNGQITPAQWAEYKRKRHRAALLGILGTVGGMLGAQPLANALGIGSGAGAASLPAAATEGMLPMSTAGTAGVGAGVGATGAAAGGAASGAGSALGSAAGAAGGMSMQDWLALITGGVGAVGGAMSQPTNTAPTSATSDPAMQELLQLMSGRIKKAEPLHDSILSMANGLLPTQYQRGGGGVG